MLWRQPWTMLFLAGFFEIFMTMSLKRCDGFTRLLPSLAFASASFLSFFSFSFALKEIPLGIAYAVWTSIGVVGTVIVGYLFFEDKVTMTEAFCLFMIVAGVAGLKLSGN